MPAKHIRLALCLLLPILSPADDDEKLDQAREVNLKYVANMPNFVADEVAKRYSGPAEKTSWRPEDTIETEITFKGRSAVRQQIRRNGKPWTHSFTELPGFKWYGGFGTEIRPLFAPACDTTLEYRGTSEAHGRELLEYTFKGRADGCFAIFYTGKEQINPPRTGVIDIDSATGNVMEYDEDATEFPADYRVARRKEHVSWDWVKIGDDTHLLPVGASFELLYNDGSRYKVEVEYKNHRHFQATTNLSFQ